MMSLKSPAEKCDGTNQSSTNRMRGEQLDDMRFKKMHQLDDGSAAPFRVNGDINSRNPPAAKYKNTNLVNRNLASLYAP